jgi:hypothetical protein
MQNLSFNDLIGLSYRWAASPLDGSGFTDCFQLTCEARRRLKLADYGPRFAWVYEKYDENTFNRKLLLRWLLQNGRRLREPCAGAVALLPATTGFALGTILEDGALFLSPGGAVIRAPLPKNVGHYFWMNQ